jgi:hypothetical protein
LRDKIRSFPVSRFLATLLVLGAFLLAGFHAGRASAAAPAPTPPPKGPSHMEKALDYLKKAKTELDAADPDRGGHRAEAVRLVADAVLQVEKAIRFDVKN